jgi:hypothetical protein
LQAIDFQVHGYMAHLAWVKHKLACLGGDA